MVGCSSGTTVSDLPSNVTSRFVGTFVNTPNTQNGTVTLDLSEINGSVSGNAIFESSGGNCLKNATVSGTNTGFNMALEAAQSTSEFTITTTTDRPGLATGEVDVDGNPVLGPRRITVTVRTSSTGTPGTTTTTSSDGTITTVVTSESALGGTLRMQFAVSNNGNTLGGTYLVEGDTCSNSTGSGTMTLNR